MAASFGGYDAPECRVAFERREEVRLVLMLRPACPLGRASTAQAVNRLLLQSDANEFSLAMGRLERYPWLSEQLARQASSSRRWNLAEGKPQSGSDNAYVATALAGTNLPTFTCSFGIAHSDVAADGDAVLRVADAGLLQAKDLGGDQAVVADADLAQQIFREGAPLRSRRDEPR